MPKKRAAPESADPPRRSTRTSATPSTTSSKPLSAPKAKKPASKKAAPAATADEPAEAPAAKKAKVENLKEPASTSPPKTGALKVGDDLPDGITLKNELDEEVDVKTALADQGAVFFIYPKAATPGCTNQACGFRDNYSGITAAGFQVFGLSMDGPKAQKNWQTKQNLQYHLLCDPKQQLIKVLGASKSATQVQRSHYIFGKGGKLLDIKSPASPKDGPGQALAFIQSL